MLCAGIARMKKLVQVLMVAGHDLKEYMAREILFFVGAWFLWLDLRCVVRPVGKRVGPCWERASPVQNKRTDSLQTNLFQGLRTGWADLQHRGKPSQRSSSDSLAHGKPQANQSRHGGKAHRLGKALSGQSPKWCLLKIWKISSYREFLSFIAGVVLQQGCPKQQSGGCNHSRRLVPQ